MYFYAIEAVSIFIDNPRVKVFHSDMFHGLAERGGKEHPHDTPVWANTEAPEPLVISRTVRGVPDICAPSGDLVVSEWLAELLGRFPNIRLAPVVFKRLVDVDYQKGDMSWAEKWGNVDPCELLRTLPDVAEYHQWIGRYFEAQTWRGRDIADKYPSAKELTIGVGMPDIEERWEVRLSCDMLRDYPMLWWGGVLMNEEVFGILDDALDRDFFLVRKYELEA